jgi:hypothetical protein
LVAVLDRVATTLDVGGVCGDQRNLDTVLWLGQEAIEAMLCEEEGKREVVGVVPRLDNVDAGVAMADAVEVLPEAVERRPDWVANPLLLEEAAPVLSEGGQVALLGSGKLAGVAGEGRG